MYTLTLCPASTGIHLTPRQPQEHLEFVTAREEAYLVYEAQGMLHQVLIVGGAHVRTALEELFQRRVRSFAGQYRSLL